METKGCWNIFYLGAVSTSVRKRDDDLAVVELKVNLSGAVDSVKCEASEISSGTRPRWA